MKTEINPKELNDNFFKAIGEEWMLVAAGNKDKFNMMTASWGGTGIMWGKPVVFVFIRPERYTREFMDQEGTFSISFMGDNKEVHKICGSKSGRDTDKVAETGLTPCFGESGIPCFEESRLTLECKILYRETLSKEAFLEKGLHDMWYNDKKGNLHIMYVAEILKAEKAQ